MKIELLPDLKQTLHYAGELPAKEFLLVSPLPGPVSEAPRCTLFP
jgi:hypothetical protein